MIPAGLSSAERRLARTLIAIAALVMLLVLTQGQPWDLFTRGPFSSDFYDAQADSILSGHLSVDPGIAAMEGIRLRHDETHLYYGIMLALARLPIVLVTDDLFGRLSRLSILVAYVGGLAAAVHLAQATRLLVLPGRASVAAGAEPAGDPDTSDEEKENEEGAAGGDEPWPDGRWRIAAFVLAMAASPLLFTGSSASVYHETEMWACTLALASTVCSFRLLTDPSRRWAYWAAGFAALATLTRAPAGIGAAAAAVVAIVVVYRHDIRRMVGPALVAGAGGLLHGAVNTARFGSPFAIPVTKQVETLVNEQREAWFAAHDNSYFSLSFLPSTILAYLRPDAIRFERMPPFVRFGPPSDELGGVDFENLTPSTSLTVSATLLLVLAVVGIVWAVRNRRFAILGILACGFALTVPTLSIGYIANRYLVDFLPPLAAAAALAVWLPIPARLPRRLPVRAGVAVLAAWCLLVNVTLAVWFAQGESPDFIEGRLRFDRAVFDAPSPGIVTLDERTLDDAPFGTLVVDRGPSGDDDCRAVYLVGTSALVTLERTPGDNRVTGTTPLDDVMLADNGLWSIELKRTGEVIVHTPSRTTPFFEIDAEPGDEVFYDIVADPLTRETYLYVDGQGEFLPERMLVGPGLGGEVGPQGPWCRLTSERSTDPVTAGG